MAPGTFDPRKLGADCDQCPLRGSKPVPCERAVKSPKMIILGQSPGQDEERLNRPFIGRSGDLLMGVFDSLGIRRSQVHLTNALLCRLPKGWKPQDPATQQALACCAPRLKREIQRFGCKFIVSMGGEGLHAATGPKEPITKRYKKVSDWAGAFLDGRPDHFDGWTVLAGLHPAFVLRNFAYLPVFEAYMERAWKYATGTMRNHRWRPTEIEPGDRMVHFLEEMLDSDLHIAPDVETGGKNPYTAPLLCVGLASRKYAISTPWPPPDYIDALLAKTLRTKELVYQNGAHDIPSLRRHGYKLGKYTFDTMLAHAILCPEMRFKGLGHDLGFIGSIHFDGLPRWKTEHGLVKDVKGDEKWVKMYERWPERMRTYNAHDCDTTARLEPPLEAELKRMPNGIALYSTLHKLAEIAIEMRAVGMQVDPTKFAKHHANLTREVEQVLSPIQKLADKAGFVRLGKKKRGEKAPPRIPFNPGSTHDCKNLFFRQFKIRPTHFTDKGEPSLNEDALTKLLTHSKPAVKLAARLVMEHRKWSKLLGTYVEGMPVPCPHKPHDKCKPDEDHVIRPYLKVEGARSGRFASQDPNLQNVPLVMRDLFIAHKGWWFVARDYDALELWILAALSQDENLLRWWEEGIDPHSMTVSLILGAPYEEVLKHKNTKGHPLQIAREQFKRVRYGYNYRASLKRIWRTLVVDYPDFPLEKVEWIVSEFARIHPGAEAYFLRELRHARQHQYVEAPLSGRHKEFYDQNIKPSEVANYPIQMTAADIINQALIRIADRTDFRKWANPGATKRIVFQMHDELLGEGKGKRETKRLSKIMKEEMERPVTLNGSKYVFTTGEKIAKSWKDCK